MGLDIWWTNWRLWSELWLLNKDGICRRFVMNIITINYDLMFLCVCDFDGTWLCLRLIDEQVMYLRVIVLSWEKWNKFISSSSSTHLCALWLWLWLKMKWMNFNMSSQTSWMSCDVISHTLQKHIEWKGRRDEKWRK